jgi:hypothetical protein
MNLLQRIRAHTRKPSSTVARAIYETLEKRQLLTVTFLSDLTFDPASTTGFGAIRVDANINNNTLTVNGVTFAKGIGAHANADITWDVSGQNFVRFVGAVGIDDESFTISGVFGTVVFRILADGNEVFNSGTVTYLDPAVPFSVDVTGVSQLRLIGGDSGDGNNSDWANFVDLRLSDTPGELDAPAAPSSVTASQGASSATISWQDVALEDGYRIFRKVGSGAWTQIGSVGDDVTSFVDTNLPAAGSRVYYHVRSFNSNGISGPSNYPTFVVRPQAITDLSLSLNTSKRAVLNWSAADGATGYRVFKKIGGGAWQELASVVETTFTDPARLRDGVRFLYHVRPFNAGGTAGVSNYVQVTGPA